MQEKKQLVHRWNVWLVSSEYPYNLLTCMYRKNVYCDIYGDAYCLYNGKWKHVTTDMRGLHSISVSDKELMNNDK